MSLGNHLFDARKDKGLSQEAFRLKMIQDSTETAAPSLSFQSERQNKSDKAIPVTCTQGFRGKYTSISSSVPHPKSRIRLPFSVGTMRLCKRKMNLRLQWR